MGTSITKQINGLFSGYDRGCKPGLALAVLDHGKMVHLRGYGLASLEHGVPIRPDTVFDIGSTSKQFVAFCVALLEHKGKLSLEDDIRDFLPEMARYEFPVKIKHLVFHTSGIRDYLALMWLAGMRYENDYPDSEIFGLVYRQKRLNFRPGTEFLYSNSGYLLLGEIIKRVSGKPLAAFAEENIFGPLGMKSTHFHDDFSKVVRNKASGYSVLDGGVKADLSLFDAVGDGGVNTTVEDLAKWDRNFYRNTLGGGQGLIDRVTAPGMLDDGRRLEYAWGLFVTEYRGAKLIAHGGAWVGYRAEMLRFPEKKFSVICLANFNQAKATYMAKQVADICLDGQLSGSRVSAAPQHHGSRRTASGGGEIPVGFYLDESGDFVEISREDGKIFLRDGESRWELNPSGKRRFTAAAAARPVEVEFLPSKAPSISVKKLCAEPKIYARRKAAPMTPRQLKRFAGTYRSDELMAAYRISASGRSLFLETPLSEKVELLLVGDGLFSGKNLSVRFETPLRARKKFVLGYGRVKGLVLAEEAA